MSKELHDAEWTAGISTWLHIACGLLCFVALILIAFFPVGCAMIEDVDFRDTDPTYQEPWDFDLDTGGPKHGTVPLLEKKM